MIRPMESSISPNRHASLPRAQMRSSLLSAWCLQLLPRRSSSVTILGRSVCGSVRSKVSRIATQRCTMEAPLGVSPTRVRMLTKTHEDLSDAKCVVYWMHAAVRSSYNHALEVAVAVANNRKLPLYAVFVLDTTFPHPGVRQLRFAADGLRDVKEKLESRGIPFVTLQSSDKDVAGVVAKVAKAASAARVITDAPMPLRRPRQVVVAVSEECDKMDIPLLQVETNVVVPLETASPKEEYAARTIRPKIHRAWNAYFVTLPTVDIVQQADSWPTVALDNATEWDLSTDSVSETDERAAEVDSFFRGGYDAGMRVLNEFVERKLAHYEKGRNEPAGGYVSNLSPYLRFGHMSPVEIALRVRGRRTGGQAVRSGADTFLEEMIVRRELAYNMCLYNDKYDSMEVLPAFARATLEDHAKDKRPWSYNYEQLECALTHCPFWNAAQIELVCTGKMHGYMRMYWCKKIIEWTATPETAFEYAVKLNNVFNIDGCDPNSYAGVAWSFGKHDQGWREREIFGKVRYMNDAGLRRKFDMAAYVDKTSKLAKSHMPPLLAAVRVKHSAKRPIQSSIRDLQSSAKKRKKRT